VTKSDFLKRRLAAFFLITILVSSAAASSNLPLPAAEATSSITIRDMKRHLSFLASDELGGRYTFSPSINIAARYLASQLESFGYRGGGPNRSFFQKVPLAYRKVDAAVSNLTLNIEGAKQEFKYADDFLMESPAEYDLSGGLVFVGYGISSPDNNHDDYAGMDVKGKIVVMVMGSPTKLKDAEASEDEVFTGAALAHGARAAIVIPSPQLMVAWEQMKSFLQGESAKLPPKPSDKRMPSLMAGPNLIKAIAKAMGKDEAYLTRANGKPLQPAMINGSAAINLKVSVKEAPLAQNVVGILEGADQKLKDEYLVISAHYDHLESTTSGQVYNGADDDGSGTVAVLEMAEAFATGPRSKRSILVVFHTGEEIGLFGSEFNTDYEPAVPIEKMVANLNIDMIGRSRKPGDSDPRDRELTDKDSVYVIGADKLSTELHNLNEQTNTDTVRLKFDYTYNDERHPQRFYYRSDHYNYAKHGVPVIFYFTGVHRDYHRTTDDVDKIDFEKMLRITSLVFATGWRIANMDKRLVVDKKP